MFKVGNHTFRGTTACHWGSSLKTTPTAPPLHLKSALWSLVWLYISEFPLCLKHRCRDCLQCPCDPPGTIILFEESMDGWKKFNFELSSQISQEIPGLHYSFFTICFQKGKAPDPVPKQDPHTMVDMILANMTFFSDIQFFLEILPT